MVVRIHYRPRKMAKGIYGTLPTGQKGAGNPLSAVLAPYSQYCYGFDREKIGWLYGKGEVPGVVNRVQALLR